MHLIGFLLLVLSIALCVRFAETLDCFKCANIRSVAECHTINACSLDEHCYTDTHGSGNNTLFSMGCRKTQQCQQTGHNPIALMGRDLAIRATVCSQCCSTDFCNRKVCIQTTQDGAWSTWTNWGTCSATCNGGMMTRTRTCDNPAPSQLGKDCDGSSHNNQACNTNACPGSWSAWSNWGSCDASCGGGMRTRSRACQDAVCVGSDRDFSGCGHNTCAAALVQSQWNLWASWGACSVTCGIGLQRRDRHCSSNLCSGDSKEDRVCYASACKDGGWSVWSSWGTCSTTCDTGVQKRSRSCNNPSPSLLGRDCVGDYDEVKICRSRFCDEEYLNPIDCYDIKRRGIGKTSGVYSIRPNTQTIQVYCDMDTAGGGWTLLITPSYTDRERSSWQRLIQSVVSRTQWMTKVFQRRYNGSVDFFRTFQQYENGFGDLHGEFWLGLKYTQQMTSQMSELRLDLEAVDRSIAYETYQNFSLPTDKYILHIQQPAGTAGDSYTGLLYHAGHAFYTTDRDDDSHCAVLCHGGWWYNTCATVNLNGDYLTPGTVSPQGSGLAGVVYSPFKHHESLKATKMMFRRK